MEMDEVNDPEWLLEWSLSQREEQRRRGGHYFGAMFTLKATHYAHCTEETHHVSCLDAPGGTRLRQDLTGMVTVEVYDENGQFSHYEYFSDSRPEDEEDAA